MGASTGRSSACSSAEEAVVDGRWHDVVSVANDVLDLAPENDEAKRLVELAERKVHGLPHELRVQPQLRQLTVLMCDQQDSSGFSDRHDPEIVHEISVHFPRGRQLEC